MTEEGQSIEEEWVKVKGVTMQAAKESLRRNVLEDEKVVEQSHRGIGRQ
jgi:leucyl aminopeptidase (aminopeptidase T)